MRTSGRGGIMDVLMFIAPAALFGGFFMWVWGGDPMDLVTWLDRTAIHVSSAVSAWCSAVVEGVTKG